MDIDDIGVSSRRVSREPGILLDCAGEAPIDVAAALVTLLVLIAPGAALLRREEWERGEPAELLGVAMAASAAFWAVSFWALKVLPVSWRALGVAALVGAALLLVLRRGAPAAALGAFRRSRRAAAVGLAFAAAVLGLRFLYAAVRLGYSGGDMTAHAALSEMIVLADGFPQSQEPLLPVSRFGSIAPGFQAVSALVSLLSGAPTYRSTIYVMCAALAALTFSLYALLRAFGIGRGAAGLGSFAALFLARNPQFFAQWGGAPTLLAAAVAFLLLRDALRLDEPWDPAVLLRTALLAAGTVLIHPLPAISFAYVYAAVSAWRFVRGRVDFKRWALNGLAVAAAAALLALPFLLVPRPTAPGVLETWARGWFQHENSRALEVEQRFVPGVRSATAATFPFFLVTDLGLAPAAAMGLGLVLGLRLRSPRTRDAAVAAIVVLATCALLYAGALGEFLPLWPSLFPLRTAVWLAVPMAAGVAVFAAAGAPRKPSVRTALVFLALGWIAAFAIEGARLASLEFGVGFYEESKAGRPSTVAIAGHELVGGAFWVETFSRDNAALTPDDLTAFAWIREHTPPAAVFANNPGDGGALLPAVAHRKVFDPHFYWFFDEGEMASWRARTPIDYIYVGARSGPAWPVRWKSADLEAEPETEEVFRSGAARVYRVRSPLDPRWR